MSSARTTFNQSMILSRNIRQQFIPERVRSLDVKNRGRANRTSLFMEAKSSRSHGKSEYHRSNIVMKKDPEKARVSTEATQNFLFERKLLFEN